MMFKFIKKIVPFYRKKVKEYRGFWENFWFQKKYTNSGKLLIKICKIPVYSKKGSK